MKPEMISTGTVELSERASAEVLVAEVLVAEVIDAKVLVLGALVIIGMTCAQTVADPVRDFEKFRAFADV